MTTNEKRSKIAKVSDFIVNGYAFACVDENIRVVNLNNMNKVTLMTRNGDVLETSMDDIEISVVKKYWERNKRFVE